MRELEFVQRPRLEEQILLDQTIERPNRRARCPLKEYLELVETKPLAEHRPSYADFPFELRARTYQAVENRFAAIDGFDLPLCHREQRASHQGHTSAGFVNPAARLRPRGERIIGSVPIDELGDLSNRQRSKIDRARGIHSVESGLELGPRTLSAKSRTCCQNNLERRIGIGSTREEVDEFTARTVEPLSVVDQQENTGLTSGTSQAFTKSERKRTKPARRIQSEVFYCHDVVGKAGNGSGHRSQADAPARRAGSEDKMHVRCCCHTRGDLRQKRCLSRSRSTSHHDDRRRGILYGSADSLNFLCSSDEQW